MTRFSHCSCVAATLPLSPLGRAERVDFMPGPEPWLIRLDDAASEMHYAAALIETWLRGGLEIGGRLGQLREAQAEASEVMRIEPTYTIDGTQRILSVYKREEDAEHLFQALREAGLPKKMKSGRDGPCMKRMSQAVNGNSKAKSYTGNRSPGAPTSMH